MIDTRLQRLHRIGHGQSRHRFPWRCAALIRANASHQQKSTGIAPGAFCHDEVVGANGVEPLTYAL
ncbi:hypothetical protein N5C12_18365 [Comamonas aquatica]|uniref:hypothetical protein n=1 Tax=Comamonas aquatica TaxID=225991 RepID=UPI00244AA3A0|nr:hypothetical protein [Comamonas aquatica]MDH0901289.1 hypothetical protein [Comamonas aquatica]